MNVARFMSRPVDSCYPFDSLAEVAERMRQEGRSCLVVLSTDRRDLLVGILTEGDVALAAARADAPLTRLRVRSAMSVGVATCGVADSAHEALATLRKAGVRRLPVVDGAGRVVGIVGRRDLERGLARSTEGSPAAPLNVEDVMRTDVTTGGADESLASIALRMSERDTWAMPILEPGRGRRILGLLTARDLVRAALEQGLPLSQIPARKAVRGPVRWCWPGDSVEAAGAIMRAYGVSRLPVVDPCRELIGLVTQADLGPGAGASQESGGATETGAAAQEPKEKGGEMPPKCGDMLRSDSSGRPSGAKALARSLLPGAAVTSNP